MENRFQPHAKVFTVFDANFLKKLHISIRDVCSTCAGARKVSTWQLVDCSACRGEGLRPVKIHYPECDGHDGCACAVSIL